MYANGDEVEFNLRIAKDYFQMAANGKYLKAYIYLGYLFENGYGTAIDCRLGKRYYELSFQNKNLIASILLGNMHFYGKGVEKDYLLSKEYYANVVYTYDKNASYNLGYLYYNGFGVVQNYSLAKQYFVSSAANKSSEAFLSLGYMYYNGYGVNKNYKQALEYFKISASLKNSEASFFLGTLYSNGDIYNTDLTKSIQYYLKCITILSHKKKFEEIFKNSLILKKEFIGYRYIANNDIGLIYLTHFQDIEKANIYLKIAGMNEYPLGQNNLGLLNQFYLKDKEYAKYMLKRSAKHDFFLAEYNLGHLNEESGDIHKAIEYYKKASKHENIPLVFQKHQIIDKRLEISKKIILCLANLKLSIYYLSISNFQKSSKYFTKAFSEINLVFKHLSKHYKYKINEPTICSYLNNSAFISQSFDYNDHFVSKKVNIDKRKSMFFKINDFEHASDQESLIFEKPVDLFNYVIENREFKNIFMQEINKIIHKIDSLLYTPPYSILFGRINIEKPKNSSQKQNPDKVNNLFYDGLQLDELLI